MHSVVLPQSEICGFPKKGRGMGGGGAFKGVYVIRVTRPCIAFRVAPKKKDCKFGALVPFIWNTICV